MSEYRKEFREFQREAYWSLPRVAGFLFLASVILGGGFWAISLLSQPGRIISKTFDADNVINNYEWYRDAYGNYQARTAQVRQFKQLFTAETDQQERSRLRIDMAAIQQSCRDLARRYNANADKINRNIFMGTSVPTNLNAGECE